MVFGHGMGQGWKYLSTGGPLVCLAKELIHLLGVWAAAPSRWSGWWVSPFQEGDWKALKHIREEQAGTRMLNSSGIAHADLDTWPVTHAITMSGYSFSVRQTTQAAHQMADQQSPKNTTTSAVGSYTDWGRSCLSSR